jgi:hypothetical protein
MRKEEEGKQPKGGLARYIWAERRRGAEGGRSTLVYAGRVRQHLRLTHWTLWANSCALCGPSQFCDRTYPYHPLRLSSVHSNNLFRAMGGLRAPTPVSDSLAPSRVTVSSTFHFFPREEFLLLKYPESVFRRAVTCSLMLTRTDPASLPKRMMKRSNLEAPPPAE